MGAVVLLQLAEFLLLLGNLCHEGLLKSHDGTGGAPPLEMLVSPAQVHTATNWDSGITSNGQSP